jgi:hypothetical protein
MRVGADLAKTNRELEADGQAMADGTAVTLAQLQGLLQGEIDDSAVLSAFEPLPMPQQQAGEQEDPIELLFTSPGLPPQAVDIGTLFDDRGIQAGLGLRARKNSTGAVLRRSQVNVIEGSAVTLTLADDGKELDLTIAVAGTAQTYTESNVTTTRTFDADTVTLAALADVVGTLVVDLRARGMVL